MIKKMNVGRTLMIHIKKKLLLEGNYYLDQNMTKKYLIGNI